MYLSLLKVPDTTVFLPFTKRDLHFNKLPPNILNCDTGDVSSTYNVRSHVSNKKAASSEYVFLHVPISVRMCVHLHMQLWLNSCVTHL